MREEERLLSVLFTFSISYCPVRVGAVPLLITVISLYKYLIRQSTITNNVE